MLNTAGLQAGDAVAVVGLGGVGMNALFAAVAGGAERIVAVDANAEKLGLARQWGATDTFLATEPDCAEQVRDATEGGLDTVIETAGTIEAMELAQAITARGGRTVSAGLPASDARLFLPARADGVGREEHPRQLHGELRAGARHSAVPPDVPARHAAGRALAERLHRAWRRSTPPSTGWPMAAC